MTWTRKDIEKVLRIVEKAPSVGAGYEAAGAEFGKSYDAIRTMLARVEGRRADCGRAGRRLRRAAREAKATAKYAPKPASEEFTPRVPPTFAEKRSAQAEQARLRTLERENDVLKQAAEAMCELTSRPLEPVRRCEKTSGLREATATALFSDVHCEQQVRLGETPVANEYNLDIADRSIARFFEGYRWLLDFHRTAFRITDVTLWLGGDLMTGHIHEENKETTASTPIETVLWLRSRIISGIDLLLADPQTERIRVPCSYGNHGRNTAKPYRAKGAAHSYEWLLYQWLATHYEKERRVQFLADQSAHQYLQVYDWTSHFHHGDETNYQGGVGGITIPLNKAVAQWDIARRCDFHNFGHWHQYIDTGRIVVNGSVVGFDAYAMSIKAAPEPPQQAFYLIDSKRGKICKSPIWVRDSG